MNNNGSYFNNISAWQAPVEEENPLTVPQTLGGVAGDSGGISNIGVQGQEQGQGGGGNTGAWGALGNIADIVGAFGNVWAAVQSNKLAKKAFQFQKDSYNTNLANSIASYNTAIEDRANSRAVQQDDSAYAGKYIKDNSLEKKTV